MSDPRTGTMPRVRAAARHPVTVTGGSLGGAGALFLLALHQGWITVGIPQAQQPEAAQTAPVERVVKLEERTHAVEHKVGEVAEAAAAADKKADDALQGIREQRAPLGALLCVGAGGKTKERRCRWRGRVGVPLDDLDGLMDAFDNGR